MLHEAPDAPGRGRRQAAEGKLRERGYAVSASSDEPHGGHGFGQHGRAPEGGAKFQGQISVRERPVRQGIEKAEVYRAHESQAFPVPVRRFAELFVRPRRFPVFRFSCHASFPPLSSLSV